MSRLRLLAVAGALSLGACVDDDQSLIVAPPPSSGVGTGGVSYFDRYVALGNSITAGYQSGGLVDTLQLNSYANILATRAGATFNVPLVARPGTPVPFVAPLVPAANQTPSRARTGASAQFNIVQNVAVPGARLVDLLRLPPATSGPGQLNLLLVGPRSQVRAMKEAQPTFVSAWAGNNDALEATVGGVLGPLAAGADSSLTPLATFQAQLNQLVDSIKAAGPRGAMLVGVVNAIDAVPLIQPGAFFFLARDANGNFQGKPVNANCSPVNQLGQRNPLASNFVSFQILSSTVAEIDCSGTTAGGAFVLDAAEQAVVRARVTAFNQAIEAAAIANQWVYVDPNPILRSFLTVRTSGRTNRIRKCQDLATATTAAQFQSAVLNTCPVTGTTAAPNFFGSLISFDGVHPSTEAHRILAGRFGAAINTRYGTTLSTSETAQ
jgi:hypothetical protein